MCQAEALDDVRQIHPDPRSRFMENSMRACTVAWLLGWVLLLPATGKVLANGQLDGGFAGGKTTSFWPVDAGLQRGATRPVKTLVQADDKVLVISNTPTPFGSQFPGNSQIGITRFNRDGSADTSYGPLGQQLLDAGPDFEVEAVDAVLRRDGAVLVEQLDGEEPLLLMACGSWLIRATGTPGSSSWLTGSRSCVLFLSSRRAISVSASSARRVPSVRMSAVRVAQTRRAISRGLAWPVTSKA